MMIIINDLYECSLCVQHGDEQLTVMSNLTVTQPYEARTTIPSILHVTVNEVLKGTELLFLST